MALPIVTWYMLYSLHRWVSSLKVIRVSIVEKNRVWHLVPIISSFALQLEKWTCRKNISSLERNYNTFFWRGHWKYKIVWYRGAIKKSLLLLPQHQSTYPRPRVCINWNLPFRLEILQSLIYYAYIPNQLFSLI